MAAPQVDLHTNHGVIRIELNDERAPLSAANFLEYVKSGHYDGTVFHRVMNGFMVQGGGFAPGMTQKPTDAPVQNEADNGLPNVRGSVAMARTQDPHSASAQFFINVKDNAFLDPTLIPPGDPVPKFEFQGRTYENIPRSQLENSPQLFGYTVFGKVVSGMDVVNKIKAVPTGNAGMHQNVPTTPVVVQSATLVK